MIRYYNIYDTVGYKVLDISGPIPFFSFQPLEGSVIIEINHVHSLEVRFGSNCCRQEWFEDHLQVTNIIRIVKIESLGNSGL